MVSFPEYPHGYFAKPYTAEWDEPVPLPPGTPILHGHFCSDGTRDFVLTERVVYVDQDGVKTVIEPPFRFNGLSNPIRSFWGICNPWEPLTREASSIHDWDCVHRVAWKKAAKRFYHAMIAAFIHGGQFGSRWKRVKNSTRAWVRWAGVQYVGIWFCSWHRGKR